MIELFVALINQVAPILGAVAACGAVYVSWRNGQAVRQAARDTQARADRVEEKLDHNTRVTQTAALDVQDARLMAKGAERAGYEGGIEEGKRQATGPMGLRTNLGSLHGPDQDDQR